MKRVAASVGWFVTVLAGPVVAQTDKTTGSRPTKQAIRTDDRGWPLDFPKGKPLPLPAQSRETRTDQSPKPSRSVASQQTRKTAKPAPVMPRQRTDKPAKSTPRPRSPRYGGALEDLFSWVGRPEDLRSLRCAVAWVRVTLFDHRGAKIDAFTVHHELDFRKVSRDRLLFTDDVRGPSKIYGRDGSTVFAELHGIPWASLESEAQQELEVLGLLMRMPWAFENSDAFVLVSRDDNFSWKGQRRVRMRFERRSSDAPIRSTKAPRRVDRFDVICPTGRYEPLAVHMRLAKSNTTKIVRLREYRTYGSVRMPTKRVFIGPKGVPVMEMKITRMDIRQELPATQFRPQNK